MPRPLLSSVLTLAIVSGFACGPAFAAGQGYDYDIYVGGSQVAEMRITIERSGAPEAARYRVTSDIGLVGMASWVSDWTARSEVAGHFVAGQPVPDRFASLNHYRDHDRTVTMSYADGVVASVDVVDPVDDDDDALLTPVSDTQKQGSVDPLSAMLAAFLSPASCGGDRRVFDGRRVSDIEIISAEPGAAPETDYGIYHGPATICVFEMQHVGGHIRRWEEERQGQSEMAVWLAAVSDDVAVPVRIEADTEWGALRGHLVGVSVQEAATD